MEVINVDNSTATVRLTRKDLIILANAINETREAIEAWEFSSRVGADLSEAEDLLRRLSALLDSMKDADP